MSRRANGPGASRAAAVSLGKSDAVTDTQIAAGEQAKTDQRNSPHKLHADLVRRELAAAPIPLSLLPEDRAHWAARGLTLAQRDAAAAELVRRGEARYEILPESRWAWAQQRPVLHLVAQEGGAS